MCSFSHRTRAEDSISLKVLYCDLNQEAQLPLSDFELDLVKSSWKRESEIENSFLRRETTHSHPLQLRVTHCQPRLTTQVK